MAGAAWLLAVLLAQDPAPGVAELAARLDAGDLDGAIRSGEAVVAADPASSVGWDLLGRAYGLKAKASSLLEQIRLARKARGCFEKAVAADPSNVDARSDLATYDMRAPAFLGGGKDKARRQIAEIARIDAARAHELSGALAEREKDLSAADAEYRRAVAAARPGDDRARRAYASFLVRQRRFPEARRVWVEVLEARPGDTRARYELAGVALESGLGVEEAIHELSLSLDAPVPPGGIDRRKIEERLARLREESGAAPAATPKTPAR